MRFCERDSSGTTVAQNCEAVKREGDGANSPTRGGNAAEAARPNPNEKQKSYFIRSYVHI